jgi:hypothetical protein
MRAASQFAIMLNTVAWYSSGGYIKGLQQKESLG